MATTVRCVFTIDGASDLTAPAPLVADVSCLTAGRLRKYATSTVTGKPKALVSVQVDGKALIARDVDLVDVPTACLIKPSAAKRAPRAANAAGGDDAKDKDGAAAAAADEEAASAESPAAAEEEPAAAKEEGEEGAAAKPAEGEEEAAAPAAEAAKEEGEEGADAAAAPIASADETAEGAAPTAAAADKKPAPKPKKVKAYQPRNPPRDLVVTIVIRPIGTGRLPLVRDVMLNGTPKVTVCSKCGECPISSTQADKDAPTLFDCGHVACACCRAAANGAAEGDAASAAPTHVTCPTCGFHTYTNGVFLAEGEPRIAGADCQVAAAAFERSPHEVVAASTRVSSCAVCKAKDAVGRCAVEQLNMCAGCHEEHLPSGPLRNSHTLLRFDSENAADALSVLCTNALHRNLPVGYFCVDHGVLGCHMCLKDSTVHEKCSIVTAGDDLAAVALELRRERETEASRVTNDASSATRTAWDSYTKLRASYEQQRAEITARADAYKEAIEKQRLAALHHLKDCYDDSVGRWEKRIGALDVVRARSATVAATLDGHRALPAGMLLHCEAANGLSFLGESNDDAAAALGQQEVIANLVVRFRKEMPSLFDVNGSHPTVDGAAAANAAPASIRAVPVRVQQTPLSAVAKRWKDNAAKRAAAAAAAAVTAAAKPAEAGKGGKGGKPKGVAGAVAAIDAATNKQYGETPRVVPKAVAATAAAEGDAAAAAADAAAAPPSPTAAEPVSLCDLSAVSAGPRDTMLLVDRARDAVVVATTPKAGAKSSSCKVVAVLGGGDQESLMFKSASETVSVAANKDHALKQPVHAFYHAKAKVVVVCDAGNDRIVLYPDTFKAVAPDATPVASPAGLLKAPMAATIDTPTGGILVFERLGITVLAADASKVLRVMKYTQAPNKALSTVAAYHVAATNVTVNPFLAMIRVNGDVSFIHTATGALLGEFSSGRLVDSATAKAMRSGNAPAAAPAAAAPKGGKAQQVQHVAMPPINAIAAHPDANVVALVSRAAPGTDAWSVHVTIVGFEDFHADPQPAPVAPQAGGRRKGDNNAAVAAVKAPTLKILRSVQMQLAAVPRAAADSSASVVCADFDGPSRLLVGVREVIAAMAAPAQAEGDATLRQELGPLRFAIFAA